MSNNVSINDINPLEHLTSDVAISNYNYESIMNGLMNWNRSKMDTVTIRLATTTDPYFVDYTIPTRYSYDKTSGTHVGRTFLDGGKFAYKERYDISGAYDPDNESNDAMTIRLTASNSGGTNWELYTNYAVYDEIVYHTETAAGSDISEFGIILDDNNTFKHSYCSGLYFRRSENSKIVLYKTIAYISAGDSILPGTNCIKYVDTSVETTGRGYNADNVNRYGATVLFKHNVYCCPGKNADTRQIVTSSKSNMHVFTPEYASDAYYVYGDYVYFDGDFYVCLSDTEIRGVAPYSTEVMDDEIVMSYNSDAWTPAALSQTGTDFRSGIMRYELDSDVIGFVARNVGTEQSDENTELSMMASIRIKGGETKEHSGMAIFDTCNYANWPSKAPKWGTSGAYATDVNKGLYQLQGYSAKMVFNHADFNVKYKNIINYDGPDLDQGLCIFLPVNVSVMENGVAVEKTPEDGMMFEFLIRIWPDSSLNGKNANDLIINKSQVYVYNIRDYVDFTWSESMDPNNVTPIAKFSMSRLTNFYVFAENVGVPDRPVLYKARFIYSKAEDRWKTYDYYQMPDHVFMSPFGFVDPMDDKAYSVETGGFPLYQDPFSNHDLRPIHVDPSYVNRIVDFIDE